MLQTRGPSKRIRTIAWGMKNFEKRILVDVVSSLNLGYVYYLDCSKDVCSHNCLSKENSLGIIAIT
jgi:hypothetical protein